MNNISDIILKLPPIIGVSLDAHRKTPSLYTIRDITYHLQMCYYWLKSANVEMKALTKSEDLIQSNEEVEHKIIIPTLLGPPEQFEYMRRQLSELTVGTWDYIDNIPLPTTIKYKLEQSYNNAMLALFNTELSTTYYEQLANTRGQYPGQ